MGSRTLYLVRHGEADALGRLTDDGREQSRLIGQRLARLPIDVLWHSPVPRAVDSAQIMAAELPHILVDEAPELVDHVPFVPDRDDLSPSWVGFFDGYDQAEANSGQKVANSLTARFASAKASAHRGAHEVLVTHAYPIAWIMREVLGAPPAGWMSLAGVANASLSGRIDPW